MGIRKRTALIAAGAAVLVAGGGGVAAWKVHEQREQEAFIADQYAKLEADKAALADEPSDEFNREQAELECRDGLRDNRADYDLRTVMRVETNRVERISEDFYVIYGTAEGSTGFGDKEVSFSCGSAFDGEEWVNTML